ncbi:MAG: SDR family NAD(P)-dependent oxidoreductase [Candidatus Nanopelagicaceae bacterium]
MKTALVTGASSGIGWHFANLLAKEGFDLVITARSTERLNNLAEDIRSKFGRDVEVISADLTTDSGIQNIAERLKAGDIEVLINNAGYGLNKSFTKSDMQDEVAVLRILCEAPMRLAHAVIPSMISKNAGTIINVSSVAAWITGGHYSATKSYLMVLSESLHTELAETAIKVTSLAPGFTHTEFHQRGQMKMDGVPKFMWLDADEVVATAWRDAQAGKAISIPGRQYQILYQLMRHLPRSLVRHTGFSFRRNQR